MASLVSIISFLLSGSVVTTSELLSLNQVKGLPILAFKLAWLSFLALAFSMSNTQSSTPEVTVLVKAIYSWFGDQEKFAKRPFSGKPLTSCMLPSWPTLTFKFIKYLVLLPILVTGLIRKPPKRISVSESSSMLLKLLLYRKTMFFPLLSI